MHYLCTNFEVSFISYIAPFVSVRTVYVRRGMHSVRIYLVSHLYWQIQALLVDESHVKTHVAQREVHSRFLGGTIGRTAKTGHVRHNVLERCWSEEGTLRGIERSHVQ